MIMFTVSTVGRRRGGTRRVRSVWIGGLTRPFAIPETASTIEINHAEGCSVSSQSGSAWPRMQVPITARPETRFSSQR
jgi:hypothetical protein